MTCTYMVYHACKSPSGKFYSLSKEKKTDSLDIQTISLTYNV